MNKILAKVAALSALALPVVVFGQTAPVPTATYLTGVLNVISEILAAALPVIIALAFIFFLWGLLKFMMAAGDEAAKEQGKQIMIWGVVILFVMLSIWGLVAILNTITGVNQGGQATAIPSLPATSAETF
jgi:hypothetical protein